MSVVFDNREHPEYQNLTNVFSFIAEMCLTKAQTMPLNKYIENLSPDHPSSKIFSIARIAPEKMQIINMKDWKQNQMTQFISWSKS